MISYQYSPLPKFSPPYYQTRTNPVRNPSTAVATRQVTSLNLTGTVLDTSNGLALYPTLPTFQSVEQLVEQPSYLDIYHKDDQVVSFIEQHPILKQILADAPQHIHQYFPDTPLSLRVSVDPEYATEMLVLSIMVGNLSPESAMNQQQQLNQAWWLEIVPTLNHSLLITIEGT